MTHLEQLRLIAYCNGILAGIYSDLHEWTNARQCAEIAMRHLRLMRIEILIEAAFLRRDASQRL